MSLPYCACLSPLTPSFEFRGSVLLLLQLTVDGTGEAMPVMASEVIVKSSLSAAEQPT